MTKQLPFLMLFLCIAPASIAQAPAPSEMDKDLLEVTIPQLQGYYASHKYTVTQAFTAITASIARWKR